jgi:hypothetical protein
MLFFAQVLSLRWSLGEAFVAVSFDLQQEYSGKQENNAENKMRSSCASQKGILNIVVMTQ